MRDENGTRTIEVEVDEQTAHELEGIARRYGKDKQTLIGECCERLAERGPA